MEWRPEPLTRDGTHWHPSAAYRSDTYKKVAAMCGTFLPESVVSLCKETKSVRRETGLCSPSCNCLA
jgi:hypothetical protein